MPIRFEYRFLFYQQSRRSADPSFVVVPGGVNSRQTALRVLCSLHTAFSGIATLMDQQKTCHEIGSE